MSMRMGTKIAIVVGAGVTLGAPLAHASNGTKPRIPVDWSGAACMTVVDRSADPVAHLPYAIPQEDTEITGDEVDDSRTHQFFSFCHGRDPQTFLPRWITQDDVDRAAAVGAAPDMVEPDDLMETAADWAGCWERITPDDDRHPITFEAAAMGVDWDTSALPAGTYTVEAYTWEPPLNIWSLRSGVVKVVDSPTLEDSGPALAVSSTEIVINKNQTATVEGCVSAMEGSTLDAYWAFASPDVEWVSFLEGDSISGETFAIDFDPPEEAAGESVLIRVDVVDPMGRSYTAYMNELVIVLGTDGPVDCDGGSFIGGAGCEDDTGGNTGTGDDTGTGGATGDGSGGDSAGTTAGQDGGDGGGGGCACTVDDRERPYAAGLLGLLLLGLRRRRR